MPPGGPQHKRKGFTVVELLVAALIFSIVLVGVGSFLTGGLNFSQVAVTTADRLREVNDASWYISDNVRRAASVVASATATDCVANATSCLAMVVPNASVGGGTIDQYLELEYHLIARSALPAIQKSADAWADANTLAMVEYRRVACGVGSVTPCAGAPTPLIGVAVSAVPYLVLDQVVVGSTFAPAAGDPRVIQLSLQVATHRRGETTVTPSAAVELLVAPRNVVP